MGALPTVGEHTSAILAELGYDRPTIDRMREKRLI
jgi:crotonobetainyl-CoA:carnitine CoA-transferase CaiB-like acyl-CoA transferase